ncbi:MAG TPA: nitrous oxide reductase accessory protein NosL [Geobacteraceae bacterium]
MNKSLTAIVALLVFLTASAYAGNPKPRKPGAGDKCAVCGMFVAKYTDFAAQLQFRDGTVMFFDGPKDLFTYYQGLARSSAGRKPGDVTAAFVTGFYTLTPIDGLKAFYVTGSNVNGPMGRELVPFATEAEAREFRKDHKGKAILRFRDITPAIVRELQ